MVTGLLVVVGYLSLNIWFTDVGEQLAISIHRELKDLQIKLQKLQMESSKLYCTLVLLSVLKDLSF